MNRLDFLVVGCGLFGAVFAQRARQAGRSVLVIERREHIGGNCFTRPDPETGIVVHAYGPHIFHTSNQRVWDYVNRFGDFRPFRHQPFALVDGERFPFPVNLRTLEKFFGVSLDEAGARALLAAERHPIARPRNLEEQALATIGPRLYEAFIEGYSRKHWGRDPKQLPHQILARLPIRFTADHRYYRDTWEAMPEGGYTPMFEAMLEDVPVELGVDFFDDAAGWRARARTVLYTGPLDRYFGYDEGVLSWRSLRFTHRVEPVASYQGCTSLHYPGLDVPHTRTHEWRRFHEPGPATGARTVVTTEVPYESAEDPYYPVRTLEDLRRLRRYRHRARKEPDTLFGGRLAEYRYYDMHHIIARALQVADRTLGEIA